MLLFFPLSRKENEPATHLLTETERTILIVPTFPKPLVHFLCNFCVFGCYTWNFFNFYFRRTKKKTCAIRKRECGVIYRLTDMSRGENLVFEIIHGARAQHIYTHKTTKKRTRSFTRTNERTVARTFVLCLSRATVGRSLSEGQRSQRRLYTGARNSH
jgi:hypothetical protein